MEDEGGGGRFDRNQYRLTDQYSKYRMTGEAFSEMAKNKDCCSPRGDTLLPSDRRRMRYIRNGTYMTGAGRRRRKGRRSGNVFPLGVRGVFV